MHLRIEEDKCVYTNIIILQVVYIFRKGGILDFGDIKVYMLLNNQLKITPKIWDLHLLVKV